MNFLVHTLKHFTCATLCTTQPLIPLVSNYTILNTGHMTVLFDLREAICSLSKSLHSSSVVFNKLVTSVLHFPTHSVRDYL